MILQLASSSNHASIANISFRSAVCGLLDPDMASNFAQPGQGFVTPGSSTTSSAPRVETGAPSATGLDYSGALGVIISTGTAQSGLQTLTPGAGTSLTNPTSATTSATSKPPSSSHGKAIPGGALFAIIFFPIVLIAGIIAISTVCLRRRRRRRGDKEMREMKVLSQGSVDQTADVKAPGRKAEHAAQLSTSTTITQNSYAGVESPPKKEKGLAVQAIPHASSSPRRVDPDPPPPPSSNYKRHTSASQVSAVSGVSGISALSPVSPIPAMPPLPVIARSSNLPYPLSNQLSETNLAMHHNTARQSPFTHPDDDQVSEVSDAHDQAGNDRDIDAVSVVSGISQSGGKLDHDFHHAM